MKTEWTGDADLVRTVGRAFRAQAAAVAVISPGRELTAMIGAGSDSLFEIASISKALTGMVYQDATERCLVSPTTTLRELLPLENHGEVGSVSLCSLAIHRSGLPGLPPGMHPLRRNLKFLVRGENPYGDSLAELLDQTRGLRLGTPKPKYSNLGFQLLGHAVAKAAGSSYEQLLHDVLGPGFSTPFRAEDLGEADLTGFGRFGRPIAAWVGEAVAPAGGVRADISTMRGFLRSVLDGTARGLSALDPVADFTPRVGIGAGWITLEHRGRPITWHNGASGGFSSWIGLDRDAGTGVVVLSAVHKSVDRLGFRLLTEFTPTSESTT
ncbi:serine hydrolase domain-containing protein [Arthrobacter sp. CAN_C5]|uniref:serine hydrolase domain-containing protein n=1 Tax=Arthrobacter sp. CAN_C5 TaxID=2760706 RepID=UPI0028A96486|nr:serine hydrolase domain-containing protein [Arthrobacter sp. CAN_C5]MBP2215085.1 CubicO group peptidase (beta-lactamase class C family) [Arthrobacter sp. CAN_C5]